MNEENSKEIFLSGMRNLKKGDMDEACRAFEKAHRLDRESPHCMSYYGMCAALRWGKIGLGLELCTRAIKKEFFKADYYLNLGRVYLASGNKKGAITVFTKGLRFDPDNDEIHEMLVQAGLRKRPVIAFLKRSHPVNKILGIIFRRTLPGILKKKKHHEGDEPDADVGI